MDNRSSMTTQTDLQHEEHAGRLLAVLSLLRRDAAYCDVLLQVEGMTSKAAGISCGVWAHRAVLAAASPFFYDMFKTSFEKCTMQVIFLRGLDLETLQELVDNLYSAATLVATVQKAEALLAAAIMLDVGDVRDAACACLSQALDSGNALGIRAFAEQHSCFALATTATEYIYTHLKHILQSNEFLALTPGVLAELLDKDRVAAIEENVFDAVLRWALHCPQERQQLLSSMLQAVRLRLVPRETLAQRAGIKPLVSEPRALLQIAEALAPRPERRAPITAYSRSRNIQPAALLVVGGKTMKVSNSNTTLICRLPGGCWQYGAMLPEPRAYAGAALLDGRVYLIGGYDAQSPVNTVYIYDIATDSCLTGPAMNKARSNLSVATLAGRLYMVGGWDGARTLDSAQALDPREGAWRPVASMVKTRRGHGIAALEERLYAIGGYGNQKELSSTERYNPVADKWQIMEPMAERRESLGVAVVDNTIYAVGGWNGTTRPRSVERYRAGFNWQSAQSIPAGRDEVAVAAHGGRLYVAGGYDDGLNCHTTVSVLDTTTAIWSELPAMPESRAAAAAVVVTWPATLAL